VEQTRVDARRFAEGLERLASAFVRAAEMALREGVKAAEASAKATSLFQDQSGGTRGSIRGVVETPTSGFVEAGGASRFLQDGTRAHRIPLSGNATLRFVVAGQVIFRAWVQHKGTKPRPFMTEARDAGERAIAVALPLLVGDVIRQDR
jgi:hypothetical protein